MDRIRNIFQRELSEASYEPLQGGSERLDGEQIEAEEQEDFSWIDYSVFLLLGVAMLWAWYGIFFFREIFSREQEVKAILLTVLQEHVSRRGAILPATLRVRRATSPELPTSRACRVNTGQSGVNYRFD